MWYMNLGGKRTMIRLFYGGGDAAVVAAAWASSTSGGGNHGYIIQESEIKFVRMEIQHHHHQEPEKVYVAIGSDIVDGFGALKFALKKWSSQFISIVILHATNDICKDYVFTPFGKLPASSLSEEKLKALERAEQARTDQILAKYIAYCGKVKAEVVKIDKHDKPFQEVLLELISSLKISKLVMALTFTGLSSWKSKSGISGSFFVHKNKPDFCELFMIYCGDLVFFKGEGENDGIIEDDKGVIVGRIQDRNSFKKWFGRMWSGKGVDNGRNRASSPSSPLPSTNGDSSSIWGEYHEEMEQYFNQLVASNEERTDNYVTDDILMNDSPDSDILKNMVTKDKIEAIKEKICSTQEAIMLFRKQVKVNIERQKRAEWAISLCSSRVENLTTSIEDEISKRDNMQKELDSRKEVIYELQSEVEEKRTKLNSILELQHDLSSKLMSSNLQKSQAEFQLEKAVKTRTRMVHEIEELRGQRDVLQRRIEFCREKDAIGNASRMSEVDVSFDYRKFTADEIRAATNDFASCLRFKSGREWTNVYKGHLKHIPVAIKLYDPSKFQSEDFRSTVELHGNIRHPHLIGIIGFCSELQCIVFEYMHNGCLRDRLFSNLKSSKGQNRLLSWHDRVRIVAEICSGLAFLHLAQPRPIVHGNLNPSKILLDRFNSTKIYGYKTPLSSNESADIQSDVMAFGNVILQILTGRNFTVLDVEAIKIDSTAIIGFLDDQPGEWPQDLAIQLCETAVKCLSRISIEGQDLNMNELMRDVDKIRQKADELVGKGKQLATNNIDEGRCSADSGDLPGIFFCPIYQDIMKNPYVAADGFSYELEAIQGWLATGRESSPMTNLKLKHTLLTPNHTLRSLIEEWHHKRSIPFV